MYIWHYIQYAQIHGSYILILLFSGQVTFGSLQLHGPQYSRLLVFHYLPEFSHTRVCLSPWFHPAISSSVAPFSSCPHSFPASGSFPMNWFLASGGQSIGALASASVLPKIIQGWAPLGLTGLISLLSKGFSRVFSRTTVWNHQFFGTQPSLWSNSHPYTTTGKTIALTI